MRRGAGCVRSQPSEVPHGGRTTPGPVEIAVLEFPGTAFNGEIVPALGELVDDGIVTILDLVLVCKDVDGSITSVELGRPRRRGAGRCSTTSTARSTDC